MDGSRLGGYRVVSELGSGGMGTVYLAEVEDVAGRAAGERVALKVVHPHLLSVAGTFKRFVREAEIGRRIEHDNVVRTFDLDAVERDGKVVHFLVMEYVEGQTLRGLLRELGRVPEELCRHVGREVARALDAIHHAGVIHRDLKPENVLITGDECVKLMDLGVARLNDAAFRLSQTGWFVGSMLYAAPEQFAGDRELDARADLYALGLLLYELATAQHPFEAADPAEIMYLQLQGRPRAPSELNPQLSPFFEEVVKVLLAKEPEDRFADAATVLGILEDGEDSVWWRSHSQAIRQETRRPLRRIRIPRETALYGRDDELAKLRALFERAVAGEGQVVLVEGEAGIGKSRLLDELVGQLASSGEDLNFLYGSYPPGGAATAAGALTAAYRDHWGVEDLDRTLAGPLRRTPKLIPSFAAMLRGEPPPDGHASLTKESLQRAFAEGAASLAQERPTVLVVDDLHFAPAEGRGLFAALAGALAHERVLLVGTTRPGLPESWTADLERLPQATRLPLRRLGPKHLARLLVDAFGSERLAQELGFRIAQKSDGNPFFVFEIVRELRERHLIERDDEGRWTRREVIEDIEIPSSVLDLIQARISVLDDAEKDLLDVAACCGYEFDPLLVAEALGERPIVVLKSLGRIERSHRLVHSAGRRYVFDHHQVQEALYDGLAELLREQYHAALADALAARHAGAGHAVRGGDALALCEHYFLGGRPADGMRYLAPALDSLDRYYLNDASARLVGRALDVEGLVTGEQRADLLLRRAGWLGQLGRRDEERAALDEALALAESLGDERRRSEVLQALGQHFERTSRYEEGAARLEEALSFARAARDTGLEASAARKLGILHTYVGRTEEAERHFQRSLTLCRELDDRWGEAAVVANLGLLCWNTGRYAEALDAYRRQLAYFREVKDRGAEAKATNNVGFLLSDLGQQDEAWEHLQCGLRLSRELKDSFVEGFALAWLGVVAERREDCDTARALHVESLELRRSIRDLSRVAESLVALGRVEATCGGVSEALAFFDEAAALGERASYASAIALAAAHRARLRGTEASVAAAVVAKHEPRLKHRERIEAHFMLWQANDDPRHLRRARDLVHFLREHAPASYREDTVLRVPMHREVLAEAAASEPFTDQDTV